MIGRRAVIGLSLLSMLVFCAVAAPSAFATKGTTGFTCVKAGELKKEFQDAHCKEAYVSGEGYRHSEIAPGTETSITISNKNTKNNTTEDTPAVLTSEPVLAGTVVVVTCTTVHGTGTQTNTNGPPMNVSGTIHVEFSECTATLNTKACESVNKGVPITTLAITSTPTETHEVKFEEHEIEKVKVPFAKFSIICNKTEIPITVKGFATGIPNGTTIEFTKASTEAGLTVAGKKASFVTNTTVTMSTTEPGIALTTTET